MSKSIEQQLIAQFEIRVFQESFVRVKSCLGKLTEDQVWQTPNEASNSIGNLVRHLIGNGRQWIFSGLLRQEDKRKRSEEFDPSNICSKAQLIEMLDGFEADCAVLKNLDVNLGHKRSVQVFEETGTGILIHVIEHMSYHTGQIALMTKLLINQDLGFYADLEL
jgi:uncharacterized damage-inducible protein DinB